MRNKTIFAGILVVFFLIASFYFDKNLVEGISFLRNGIVDNVFLFITFASSEIIICFVLTSLFLWRENKRRWIFPLWLTLGITAIINFTLKIIVQRERPFQLGIVSLISNLQEASYSIWNFSFPSFQSALVFCAIPILSEQFPRLKKFWLAFAVLVAFSRVYFGVHFVSDVIAGGILGYLIGMIIMKLEKKYNFGKKVYEKIFRK
ncbi:MAG: phosphatase PAP2 family protein [Candidatus Nanoarchaeia archaeon]|nr:phosphatase PAP2 family protein [Candidatus Nanoarchaeia archaeon]MDD5357568.1 phosphatase PAP2 family protein [Candidatus Nanoarchaeia archaeon]MDD5588487.1 phosphatase PAP2 family protein [Candidatus Nanoarchaeia archaeon]